MTNPNHNVEAIMTFEDIDPTDLQSGFKCYSSVEQQIEGLQGSVADWLHGVAHSIWIAQMKISEPTLDVFTKELEAQVKYITSDSAGIYKLTKGQAALSGKSSLAVAYKKIKNGLEANLSLDDYPTCYSLAEEVSRLNKVAKEALKAAKTEAGIMEAARAVAREEGIDPDTDVGKTFVEEKVIEIRKNLKKTMSDDSPAANLEVMPKEGDGGEDTTTLSPDTYAVPERLKEQAPKVIAAIEELIAEALGLLEYRSLMTDPDLAATQIIEKLHNQKEEYHKQLLDVYSRSLKKQLTDEVPEFEKELDEVA